MIHRVKCYVDRFNLLLSGGLRSDVRFNDRNYQVGDSIIFEEGFPSSIKDFDLSGRWLIAYITNIDTYGIQPGYVNLSLDFKLGDLYDRTITD